jgi:hypothetical protein
MQWIWSFQAYYQLANIFTVGLTLGQVYYQKREFGMYSYFRDNHFRGQNLVPPFKPFPRTMNYCGNQKVSCEQTNGIGCNPQSRIIGGSESYRGEFPWMVC